MEKTKENRFFKLRISRIFRSSFRSCRSRNVSDVIEKAVLVPHQIPRSLNTPPPPSTPKPRPFPSICRHSCPNPTRIVNDSCIISAGDVLLRSRTEQRRTHFYEKTEELKKKRSVAKRTKKNLRKNHHRRRPLYDFYGGDWSSSDDDGDGEIDTLFSSRSTLSSNSSPKRHRCRSRRKNPRRLTARSEKGESFAVVKRSSDPYGDFRTSMVEMIVERQIFGAAELEKLLQCFLGLNSTHHHATILEVFKDICDTLLCNLS